MPRMLHAAVSITLPADEFEAAATLVQVAPRWAAFVDALTESGLKFERELQTSETKAKRTRMPRTPRTPRLVAVEEPQVA